MSTLLIPPSPLESPAPSGAPTIANLLEQLGGIPAERVRYKPMPGTATEQDVIDADAHQDRFCELIDGTLVEKTIGFEEGQLAFILAMFLNIFVRDQKLGIVIGEGGMIKLLPRQVRIPDVAFYSFARLPGGKIPKEPIPTLTPDLTVEVLSESNTKQEMQRKVGEYFQAGVRLVWLIDPKKRTADIYTNPDQSVTITEAQSLDGGEVLPGFTLSLHTLFAELDQ